MTGNLVLGDQAFLEQRFDVTVVAGALHEGPAAEKIGAGVADVQPPDPGLLNQGANAGCARFALDGQTVAEGDDRVVGGRNGRGEKFVGRAAGHSPAPERPHECVSGRLGCALAFRMAAHAVYDHEQSNITRPGQHDPVLVLFAIADESDFGRFDAQAAAPGVRCKRVLINLAPVRGLRRVYTLPMALPQRS
jgi:hypothetical protein